MTQSFKTISIIFLLLFSSTPLLHATEPLLDPFYTQGQEIQNLPPLYSVQESVDPFSGYLRLVHTDVFIPGDGGLNLAIMRKYNSAIWGKRDSPYVFVSDKERSPLGIGWSLHMGIVRNPNGTGSDNVYITNNPVVEMPDGSQHVLYRDKSDSTRFISKEHWIYRYVDVSGIWELTLTDGTVYTFESNPSSTRAGYWAWDNTEIAQCIKIQNPSKTSTIEIKHDKTSGTGPGYGYSYIKTVTLKSNAESVGRTLTFNYNFTKHELTSIAMNSATLMSYEYTPTAITGAGTFDTLIKAKSPLASLPTPKENPWTYSYSAANGELQTITYPSGGTITYEHSDVAFDTGSWPAVKFSVVTKRTTGGRDVTSGVWTYQYETGGSSGNVTTITAPDSVKEVHKFNAWGNSPSGKVWQIGLPISNEIYLNNSLIYKEAFAWTQGTEISYDDIGNPSWNNGGGMAVDYSIYVPFMSSKSITRDGKTYTANYSDYDVYGNPKAISETGDTTRSTSISYWYNTTNYKNIVSNKPSTVTVTGNTDFPGTFTTDYTYDSNNGNLKQVSKYGVVTNYAYNYYSGNLESITDANGNKTSYEWTNGRISKKIMPQSLYSITRVVNSNGTIASETNGRGYKTSYTYDDNLRLASIDPPVGNTTSITYATDNSYKKETRDSYYAYTYYDGFGRTSGTKDSKGITTDIVYTAYGPEDNSSSNVGDTISYDLFERPESVLHQDNDTITYAYSGSSVTVTDEALNKTYLTYYAFGNPDEKLLVSVKDDLDNTTDYDYNILGSLTKITQGAIIREFTYDAKNFLTGESHPDRGTISYERYNLGNIMTKTDGLGATTYNYDALNRLTQIRTSTETVTIGYDNADNRTQLDNGSALIDYTYDDNNRLTRKDETLSGTVYTTKYGYDLNDNLANITYPSNRYVQYSYNTNNQITSVTGFGGSITSVTYYTSGTSIGLPRTYTYSNGHTTTVTYNQRNLTLGIDASAVNLDIAYGYDSRGNTTSITNSLNSASSQILGYDDLNRLLTFNGPWGGGSYTYDALGNRKTKSVAASSAYNYTNNRLTSVTGAEAASYHYNNDGDLDSLTASGTTYTLKYDLLHNVKSYEQGTNVLASYSYDGDGMRVAKTANNKTVIYHYDQGGRVLAENDENGNLIADYVYLHGKLVAKAAPIPAAPTSLEAWPAYTAQNNLKWTDNANNEQGYTIERKTGGGSYSPVTTVAANQTTYSDTGLTPGVTYYYRVSAFNQAGTYLTSNEASATPVSNPVPVITATPASEDYGTVIVGSAAVTKTFTVTNSGTDDVYLYVVHYAGAYGPNNAAYSVSSDACSALTLRPHDMCTFALTFSPQATGTGEGTVHIPSAQLSEVNVPVSGFGQKQFTLTILKAGTGTGTITSSPAGIDCGSDCTETYNENTAVTLTPTYSSCSPLAGWSGGGCAGTGTCPITMTANTTVTATFNLAPSTVDFIGTPTTGIETVTVNFTDLSTCDPTSWSWNFGDGTTSTLRNPSHTYTNLNGGSYTVSLSATNNGGPATATMTNYITVQACPNLPVRIAGTTPVYYSTLQDAYNAAPDGATIQSRVYNFTGDLNINRNLTLEGGYDCNYSSPPAGFTTLQGMLTTSAGTLTIKNFILQK
jgi:YD repeat-containing protein